MWWADANGDQVAATAAETQNARGEDVRPGSGWADPGEARTEYGSEPAGMTGDPQEGVPLSVVEERRLAQLELFCQGLGAERVELPTSWV